MNKELLSFLSKNDVRFELNVDLKKKTWIHRGGKCGLFISPNSSEQLLSVVQYLYTQKTKFQLFGHTSNVYILNTCDIPIVVSTMKCNKYELFGDEIICESGASVIRLANDMIRQGISGFEYLTGLPGTIGAALYNNSSCKNNSISKLLIKAEVLLEDGRLITMRPEDMQFSFRNSVFKMGHLHGIIIRATLKANIGDSLNLQEIAKVNNEERARLLEGHAKNLGCTVNRCFINGNMPFRYSIPHRLYLLYLKVVGCNYMERKRKTKNFLCNISGYKMIAPYISDVNPIIFVWRDERADEVFPLYLEFMKKIYKTDKIEIEIVR